MMYYISKCSFGVRVSCVASDSSDPGNAVPCSSLYKSVPCPRDIHIDFCSCSMICTLTFLKIIQSFHVRSILSSYIFVSHIFPGMKLTTGIAPFCFPCLRPLGLPKQCPGSLHRMDKRCFEASPKVTCLIMCA